MADVLTGPNVLREYLTGAASDNAAQSDPRLSLGGYRSSSLAKSLDLEIVDSAYASMEGLTIKEVSGANDPEVGLLTVTPTSLQWKDGEAVEFAESGEKLIPTSSPNQFLRIEGFRDFTPGILSFNLRESIHNVFGMNVVQSALAASGGNQYRATIVRNEAPFSVFDFYRCLQELGTSRVSASAQLGASGAGTITISTGTLDDWPESGWCRIVTSAPTLREIVYYTSRTSTSLTVPSAGRARFASTASAGAGTDTIHAVPGIAIGLAAEGVQDLGEDIATIANESTAPTGITWNTGISHLAGINVALLAAGKQIGIWMWREIPVGAIFSKGHSVRLETAFDDQVTIQRGKYRIQNDSARGYVAYVGVDELPDLTAAYDQFSATLPMSIAYPLPVSDETLYVVVRKRNGFGFISNNQQATIISLTPSGVDSNPVVAPTKLVVTYAGNGVIIVVSQYSNRTADPDPADYLRIWVDETEPDIEVDTPTVAVPIVSDMMRYGFGAYDPGTYYVVTAHYRSADDRQSTGLTKQIVIVAAPAAPIPL